jgi:hypothetical protein
MRHNDATRSDLRRLALWLTVEQPQLKRVIEVAVDTVLSVAHAPFWLAARAARHYVETPFLVSSGERQLLNGVIDLDVRRLHEEFDAVKGNSCSSRKTWTLNNRLRLPSAKALGRYRVLLTRGRDGCVVFLPSLRAFGATATY